MFCPRCRDEFRSGIVVCPDCELPLVAERPAEDPPDEYETPVVVATFASLTEASLARGALEAAGIPAFVPGEDVRMCNFKHPEWGSAAAEILVRPEDRERALEFLKLAGQPRGGRRPLLLLAAAVLWSGISSAAPAGPPGLEGGDRRAAPVALEAVSGVLKLFDSRPLVAMDEGPHHTEQTHAFLRNLVRDPRFARTVNDIVVEFGSARFQDVMDRYISGQRVSIESLRPSWRETTQVYVFDNPVYRQFFETVRAVNQKLPPARRLRVLLADPPIDWTRVRTFDDWTRESPRDSHAASVIEREVLRKSRKALLVFGGFGHLQRRDIFMNFQPTPGDRAGVLEQIERARPGSTFNVWSNTNSDDLAVEPSVRAAWPVTALLMLKGTSLGARDFATVLPEESRALRRTKLVDGKRVPIPPAEYGGLPLEENFDALLYLGPVGSITRAPDAPCEYRYDAYYAEVVRRAGVLNGMNLEEVRREREECLKRRRR